MKTLFHWLLSAVAVMVAAYILPGIAIGGFFSALVVALVLGIVNAFLKPLLLLVTLPLNILTLGLFTFVINALLIELTSVVVPGFAVANFGWALLFGLVLSVVNYFLQDMAEPA